MAVFQGASTSGRRQHRFLLAAGASVAALALLAIVALVSAPSELPSPLQAAEQNSPDVLVGDNSIGSLRRTLVHYSDIVHSLQYRVGKVG